MKCGIMTFYFAHNYGAVLQTYALKHYLQQQGHDVYVIDYVPQKLKNEYSLNPFARCTHPKAVVKRILRLPKRYHQHKMFSDFINKELGVLNNQSYDVVFFGSDQIWNEAITGETSVYYGTELDDKIKKVAYAASFGTSVLSDFQKNCCRNYLPSFFSISLRESDVIRDVKALSGKEVVGVLDPVLLLERDEWRRFAQKASFRIDSEYILYYALRNDDKLISKVANLESQTGMKVVCVHPTCNELNVGWEQLYNVGPHEFVSLIQNASYVATNSFHAIVFSILFGKKVVYKSYSKTESRVPSILNLIGFDYNQKGESQCFDFSKLKDDVLSKERIISMDFLRGAFE